MSMNTYHYVGWYFLCPDRKDIDPYEVFPNEDFCRIWDEGGSDINKHHVYIPNRECPDCYHLDKWSKTGFIDATVAMPEMISKAAEFLMKVYDGESKLKHGILCYVN